MQTNYNFGSDETVPCGCTEEEEKGIASADAQNLFQKAINCATFSLVVVINRMQIFAAFARDALVSLKQNMIMHDCLKDSLKKRTRAILMFI